MGCCGSEECTEGQCFPPFDYCGGIVGPQNRCLTHACWDDEGCGLAEVCVLAGLLGYPVNTCMPAYCRTDSDCSAAPGGRCAPIEDRCCLGIYALFCVYPDHCQKNIDCPLSAPLCYGDPATEATTCVSGQGLPGCPI
jgi:hypothetical protein